ncbi:MAG TPA: guanylate kinase [Patescibacteria group bacterium]|nr:guanylate kinase [Patescibacteria group bacterium]
MNKKIITFSAPSGSGKTTIIKHILEKYPQLGFAISATSREPRGSEVDGIDYYFLSEEDFRKKIDEGVFVEWEEVYEGRFYGTLKSELERIWNDGKIVIIDADFKGALNIKKIYGDGVLSIFIRPPSLEVLEKRLRDRGTDSAEEIEKRVAKAGKELSFENDFDVILINDQKEVAFEEINKIVEDFLRK